MVVMVVGSGVDGGWDYTIILRGSDRVLLVVGLGLAVVVRVDGVGVGDGVGKGMKLWVILGVLVMVVEVGVCCSLSGWW